jgi:hypothetical protein
MSEIAFANHRIHSANHQTQQYPQASDQRNPDPTRPTVTRTAELPSH